MFDYFPHTNLGKSRHPVVQYPIVSLSVLSVSCVSFLLAWRLPLVFLPSPILHVLIKISLALGVYYLTWLVAPFVLYLLPGDLAKGIGYGLSSFVLALCIMRFSSLSLGLSDMLNFQGKSQKIWRTLYGARNILFVTMLAFMVVACAVFFGTRRKPLLHTLGGRLVVGLMLATLAPCLVCQWSLQTYAIYQALSPHMAYFSMMVGVCYLEVLLMLYLVRAPQLSSLCKAMVAPLPSSASKPSKASTFVEQVLGELPSHKHQAVPAC